MKRRLFNWLSSILEWLLLLVDGTWRSYQPLPRPRPEATEPHYIPRVRGRHNGHLRYTGGLVVDTGKLVVPGGRA